MSAIAPFWYNHEQQGDRCQYAEVRSVLKTTNAYRRSPALPTLHRHKPYCEIRNSGKLVTSLQTLRCSKVESEVGGWE